MVELINTKKVVESSQKTKEQLYYDAEWELFEAEQIVEKLIEKRNQAKLPENDFMNKIFPAIVKHLDENKILEFGQNRISAITQKVGNARMQIHRDNSTVTLTIEVDSQEDLSEARELAGV